MARRSASAAGWRARACGSGRIRPGRAERACGFPDGGGAPLRPGEDRHPAGSVFVDETWAKTNMTRTRGWSPRGTPLLAKVPHGHWKTLTFLAGLRHDRIVAPCVIAGPINGLSFTAWVSQFLAPTLRPGDIVIADNLGSHKGRPVRDALRAVGAKLFFLPAYSPDLNPIEMMFAKLKTLLRKADERSVETTWRKIGDLLAAFTEHECAAYLRHAGYASVMV